MPVTTPKPRAQEEMPESQRVTIPSPPPFPRNARRARSPGEYHFVGGEEASDPQSCR